MRWALSHTAIACFAGTIPQKPTKRSVEGILLHELLERYNQHLREHRDQRFRPRATLLVLLEAWDRKNENNPRINSNALAAQIGIEDVLSAFGKAARHIERPEHEETEKTLWRENDRTKGLGSHAEVWLNDPESKLRGRADYILSGEIIDFKSGDEEADHINQIIFYAALYLAFTNETPRALRLSYAARDSIVNVPLPKSTALRECLAEMRQRAATADRRILEGDLPAKPEPLKCARCNARALCDKYWESQHLFEAETADPSKIIDYAPSSDAHVEMAAHGVYLRDRVGSRATSLYIPNGVLAKAGTRPARIRVLSVRAASENEIVRLGLTQNSEFYIFV
jgi:CRISPR/Cas system-associated exonuclease Cas4 (RecB family)